MTSHFVAAVTDDLQMLRDTWPERVTEHKLRRDSATLRRLLVHGDLRKAWRLDGHAREARILTTNRIRDLPSEERAGMTWASEGGFQQSGILVLSPSSSNRNIGLDYRRDRPGLVPLSRWVDGPVAVAHGTIIKRSTLVKYVANKLGGAHYDEQRGARAEEQAFAQLDRTFQVGDSGLRSTTLELSPVYAEMLAIGQAVLRSEDIGAWLPGGGLPPIELPDTPDRSEEDIAVVRAENEWHDTVSGAIGLVLRARTGDESKGYVSERGENDELVGLKVRTAETLNPSVQAEISTVVASFGGPPVSFSNDLRGEASETRAAGGDRGS